jgi:hypothetical protein
MKPNPKTKEFVASIEDALDFIDGLVKKKIKKYGLHHRKINDSYDNAIWFVTWTELPKDLKGDK